MADHSQRELQHQMDGLRLIRAFFRINDRDRRRAVIDFAEQMLASQLDSSALSNTAIREIAEPRTPAKSATGRTNFVPLERTSQVIPICLRCKEMKTLMPSPADKEPPVWRCFKCVSD